MNTSRSDATTPTNVHVVRRERELRPSYMDQIEGSGAPRRITVDKNQLVLGRDREADICLQSQRASRQHAFITRRGTDHVLRDNESHNGIFLNGIKIHSAILREGDVIQVADSVFIFHEG